MANRPATMIADFSSSSSSTVDRQSSLYDQYMITKSLQDVCRIARTRGGYADTIEHNIRLNEDASDPDSVAAATIRPLAERTYRNMAAAVAAGTQDTLMVTLSARCVAYDPTA